MISFIYFDVGGVAMHDFSKNDMWNDLMNELGVTSDNKEAFDTIWNTIGQEICLHRDVETLVPALRDEANLPIPADYSLLNGFINRFAVNKSIGPLISKLHKTYPVGLLTNMYPRMLPIIMKRGLIPDEKWDAVIDSSVVGFQKPDAGIFKLAETAAKVPANEIFFVENSPEHIEAAAKRGWQTFLYDPSQEELSTNTLIKLLNMST